VTTRPATAPGGVAEPAARCRSVARCDCDDSTDRFDRDESVERLDIDEPSDRNDANDPTDPMPRPTSRRSSPASHEGLKLRLPRTRDEPSTDL
jgi:hypothetical protein